MCKGGELFDKIIEKEFFSEKEAAKILTEEGELISNLQGFGNEEYDMDEYVNRMERII